MNSENLTFTTDVELRFSDLDAYGHVNNAVFFTYLETARTKLFFDKFTEYFDRQLFFLVVKAECEYRKPIGLSDWIAVTMEIERIGRSSFDIGYSVHNRDGDTYAIAKTVMVCYDGKKKATVAVPEDFIQHLT